MQAPAKFRKRPVVIDAIQWTGDNFAAVVEFLGDDFLGAERSAKRDEIHVQTLEGPTTAHLHWWLIRGVHGEHYPCDPKIFAKTYDPADEDEDD